MIGELRLRVVQRGGESSLADARCGFPLQVLRPHASADGRTLELVVLTPCGGLLDGDELHAEVVIEQGAKLRLRTQAATQVHCGHSTQSWHIAVCENAAFSLTPRALVPHAQAVHHVSTSVALASSSVVLMSEVIAPGRTHQGESLAYEELRLDLDIRRDGKLIARERQLIRPRDSLLPMQLGPHSHFGSAYLLGADIAPELAPIEAVALGVSELAAGGYCIRALGHRAFDLEAAFDDLAARCFQACPRAVRALTPAGP